MKRILFSIVFILLTVFLSLEGYSQQKKYDFEYQFKEGLAKVVRNEKYGFINENRQEVVPLIYDGILDFSEGLACVMKGDKFGYIDKTGKVVIPLIYDDASSFSEGLVVVGKNEKIDIVDDKGKVTTLEYGKPETSGYALIAGLNKKYGFIDKTGKVVIPLKYDNVVKFSEGLAAVKLNDKMGYIDKTSKVVIPFKYDETYEFSEGLAAVKLNKKSGYVNKAGDVVIPLKYDRVFSFQNGLGFIIMPDRELYVDKDGNEYATEEEGRAVVGMGIATEPEIYPDELNYKDVEVKPLFMGQDISTFPVWVAKNIRYPMMALENGVQGRVFIQMLIDIDGSVKDIKVLRKADPSLDREAVRVVNSSPKFTPGKHENKLARVVYSFPVDFKIGQ